MKVVIQRVSQASVTINGEKKGSINNGLLILLGIVNEDNQDDISWLCKKIANLRIFPDENQVMNRSLIDVDGQALVVSQFTLHASTKKGNRPSYILAARPEVAYYKFLIKVGKIETNPLAKHKALKTSKKIQVPFSEAEIEMVINELNEASDFEGMRNRLIIELFYATGIRRIELVNLQLNDIDIPNRTLKVLGKRNKERLIPLIPSVIDSLKNYLEARKTLEKITDESHLFLTKKGVKIYETLVYRIINDYFSKASSKVKRSPHIIRHSFATHLLNQGANLNAVKELLGHSSLAATQIYTHNSIAELKKVYQNTHPRSKK